MTKELKIYQLMQEGGLVEVKSLGEALAAYNHAGYLWFNYCQSERKDMDDLIGPLGLHPLSVEDTLDDNQIPKVEDYPNHTFILFNAFFQVDGMISVHEVDLFIGDHFLITVCGRDPDGNPVLAGCEKFVQKEMNNALLGPAYLAHIVMDIIVDNKFHAIESLEDKLDNSEDSLIIDHQHFSPRNIIQLRRDLLTVRKSLFHEREILVKICRRDCQFVPEKAIYYYRDIYDHLAKFFELTEAYRDIVSSLMDMYLSLINNEMTRAANDTNITVRRLTLITTIFMPLGLLAGIGGMSEWSMMTGPENWRWSYPLFFAILVILAIINYFILKWMDARRKPRDEKGKGGFAD